MRLHRARDEAETSHEQNQHHERIEKARRLKIDVHVGDHARQNEKRPRGGEQPPDDAAAVPEQNGDAEQQREQGDAEGVGAPEAPTRPDHAHLIGQKIAPNASHGEAHQEFAEQE